MSQLAEFSRDALEEIAAELALAPAKVTSEMIEGTVSLESPVSKAARFIRAYLANGTPAAEWREKGEPDPHGNSYEGERASLTLGHLTDDQLANGVFMHGNEATNLVRLMSRDPTYFTSIVWLTAAKDRIRWLSRALSKNTEAQQQIATLLHWPKCWDTAAYPTLEDAIVEALQSNACTVCAADKS